MVKIGPKSWFFGSFWEYFLFMPSYTLWVYAPRFSQIKGLIKIYICCKFHQYSICGCEVKNFQYFSYWFSIHEMVLFWRFWALTLPNIVRSYWNFDGGSPPTRQTVFENTSIFSILAQMERTQSLQFWSILGPNLPPENQKYCLKPKFLPKLLP